MRGGRSWLEWGLSLLFLIAFSGAGPVSTEDDRSATKPIDATATPVADDENQPDDLPVSPADLRSTPIYSNSGDLADPFLITRPGAGCLGRDVTDLQSALGLNAFGFNCVAAGSVTVADDFVVPTGQAWAIDQLVLYLYQPDISTPSITGVSLRMQATSPAGGTSPTLTSYIPSVAWTSVQKNKDTDPPASECSRRIQQCVITLAPSYVAATGTHYVIWQASGSGASGPWVPPVVVPGAPNKPGANAMVAASSTGGLFAPIVDSGSARAPQDLVFVLRGTISSTVLTGDMNCDGLISYADINPFVLALSGEAAYAAQYPNCRWLNADIDGNGQVTYADINPFVQLVSGAPLVHPGDLNCDGLVTYADINPFVLALSSQSSYEAYYPNCRFLNADANGDGTVSYADINAFVALVSGT